MATHGVRLGLAGPKRQPPRGAATPTRRCAGWLIVTLCCNAAPLRAAPAKRAAHASSVVPEPILAVHPAEQAPTEWLPSRGAECIKSGPNRGFCAGPRRVPKPHGEAAEVARRLGLGARTTCSLLLLKPPPAAWVDAAQAAGAAASWQWPVEQSRLLRGIGNLKTALKRRIAQFKRSRRSSSQQRHAHEGLDIGAREGAAIHAAQNGLVVYSDNGLTGYGNALLVVHKDGSVALYGHCRATYVFAGQRIERGQVIGEVGHTGYARGAHVHFEYRVDGHATDPNPLFAPHE